jgi:nucleotide-binding universal stress UspA family protein
VVYSRILVGFEGSPESHEALRKAIELARRLGAEVRIVTVVPPPSVVLGPLMTPEEIDFTPLARAAEEELKRIAEEASKEGVSVTHEVRLGEPATELLEAAEEWGADLIVLGRRRLSGLERVAIGSVSSKVANHAGVDVLIVRHHSGGEAEGA